MKGRLFVTPKSQNEILNSAKTQTEFLLKDDLILSKVSNTTYFNNNGINLVRNSEFLDEMNRWEKNSPDITYDANTKFENANSIKINKTGLATNAWTTMLSEPVPVTPGITYTASIYAYTDDITTIDQGVGLEIQWYNATNIVNRLGTVGVPVVVTQNGTWTRFSVTATMPADAVQARLRFHITRNGRMWFSKPMLEKGDIVSAYRPHVEDMVTDRSSQVDIPVRYIRDWLSGSSANAGSHWVQIQAFKDGTNVALNKSVTGSVPEYATYPYSNITNGNLAIGNYGGASQEDRKPKYVTVDLGSIVYNIEQIQVYHYYDGRIYAGSKTEVSADGVNWTKLFDSAVSGTYVETSAGKKIYVNMQESVRKAESSISQTANKISLVVSETDQIKGNALVSAINVQPGTVQISAKNVNIDGAVKFSSFNSDVRASLVDSASPENIFPNGKFEDWEAVVPNGWTRWTGTGSLSKSTTALSHGFSPKFAVTATQDDGIYFVLNGKPENQFYIVEFGFMLESGNGVGAGLLLRHHSAINGGASYKEVKVQVSDYITNPVVGQWYTIRTFIEIPKFGGTTSYTGYVMANYNGFSGGLRSAKTISFDKVLWRPATENEIQTNNKWVAKKYNVGAQASASYEPTFELLSRFTPSEFKVVNDATSFVNIFTGDYYVVHYATALFVPEDKTITLPAVTADDSVAIYVNGIKAGFKAGATASTMTVSLKTGWNNVDILLYEHTGGESVALGTKISDSVLLMQPSQNPSGQTSALSDGLARVISGFSAIEEGVTKIDGGKILTNTVTAKQIAANTIRAENLFVGDMTNMMQFDENALVTGRTVATHTDNLKYFKTGPTAWMGIELTRSEKIEFKVGDSYYLGFNGFKESAITGAINMIVRYYYTDGSATNAGLTTIPFSTSVSSLEAIVKITAAPTTGKTIGYVSFFIEKDNTATGFFYMRNIELRKMYAGKMIVDGTIDANKVTISSSTAGVTINSTGVVANNATTGVSVIMNSSTGFEIKKEGVGTVFTVDSTGSMYAKNLTIDGGTITWGTGAGKTAPPTAAQVGAAVAGDITTAINNVQVGARNLFKLSSFKDRRAGDTVTMSPWGGNVANAYFSDDVPANLSGRSLKINTTTEGTGGAYWDDDSVTIESGKTYTMSYYAKATRATAVNGYIVCLSRLTDNAYITGPTINITTDWQRYSFTFTATAGQAGVYRRRHMVYQVNLYSIGNVQLEEGNKLSAWSLNPDEIVKDIDDVNVGGTNYVSGLGGTTYTISSKLYGTDGSFASTQTINNKLWMKFTGSQTLRIASIPIEVNTMYTWSFTVYTTGTGTTLRTNQWSTVGSYNTITHNINTSPTRLKITFTSQGATAPYEILHITGLVAADSYYFADFQLEKGNKATDWSQGISDLMTTADLVSGWKYPNKTTIGGNFIETRTVTASQIATNTLTANEIAANTIATKNLLVTDFTNLIDNGNFEEDVVNTVPKGWTVSSGVANAKVVDISAFQNGNGSKKALGLNAITIGNNDAYGDNIIDVKPGDEFYLEAEGRYASTAGTGYGRLGFQLYDAKKAPKSSWKEVINWVAKTTSFSGGASPTTDTSPKTNTFVVPAGTYGIQVWASFSKSNETTNTFYIDNITVRRRNNANLIVDGAITVDKIDVNAIQGKIIKLGGDSSTDLGSGSLTVFDSANKIIFSADESGTNIAQLAVSGDLRLTGDTGRLYTDSYSERTSYTHPCWTGQKPGQETATETSEGGDYDTGNIVIHVMAQSVLKSIEESRDGTRERPFTSIQEAIDSVPKILDHNVIIKVFPYRYEENLKISGFTGTGTLEIKTVIWGVQKIIDTSNGTTSPFADPVYGNASDHWTKLYMFEQPSDTDVVTARDRRLRDHEIFNPDLNSTAWTVSNVTTSNSLGPNLAINKKKVPTANYQNDNPGVFYTTGTKASATPSNGEEFVAGKGYIRIDFKEVRDLAGIKVFKYTGGLRRDSSGRLLANNWRYYKEVETWVSGPVCAGFDVDYVQGNLTSFNAANDDKGSFLSWGGFMKVWDNRWIPRDYYFETEFGHTRGGVIAGKIEIKGNSNYTVAMTNFHIDGTVTTSTSAMDVYRNAAFVHLSDLTFIQDPDGSYAALKFSYTQGRLDECEFTGCSTDVAEINYFSAVMIDGIRGGDLAGGPYAKVGAVIAVEGSTWSYTGDPAQDIKTSNSSYGENGKDLVTSAPNTFRSGYGFRKNEYMGTLFANPNSLLNQNVMDGCWNEDREICVPPSTLKYYATISSVSTVAQNSSFTLTVMAKNSNGAAISGATVNFTSNNTTFCKFGTGLTTTGSATTNSDGKATIRVTNKNTNTSTTGGYANIIITASVGSPVSKTLTKTVSFAGSIRKLVSKIKTFTASYSESYHTGAGVWNGNYTGRDVIQNTWSGNTFKGCWFFGTTLYKTCSNYEKISKVRVYVGRKSGGYNSARTANLYYHKYTSKPSGSPTLLTTASTASGSPSSISLAVDAGGWVTLNSTMVAKLKSGEVKGFGLINEGSYFRASGSLKVEVTYQVYETI